MESNKDGSQLPRAASNPRQLLKNLSSISAYGRTNPDVPTVEEGGQRRTQKMDLIAGRTLLDEVGAREVIEGAFVRSGLKLSKDMRNALAMLLFRDARDIVPGYIPGRGLTTLQLHSLARAYAPVAAAMDAHKDKPAGAADKGEENSPIAKSKHAKRNPCSPRALKAVFFRCWHALGERWPLWVAIVLWTGANAGFFYWGYAEIQTRFTYEIIGAYGGTAKGCARMTQISGLGMLFYMLREVVRVLRKWKLARLLLGLDYALVLHRLLAAVFFLAGFLHGVLWVAANYPRLLSYSQMEWQLLLCSDDTNCRVINTDVPPSVLYGSYVAVSGYVVSAIGVAFVLWICISIAFREKNPNSEIGRYKYFLWSHYAFAIAMLGVLLIHPLPGVFCNSSSTSWVFIGPVLLLWILSFVKRATTPLWRRRVQLLSVQLLPGPWIALKITKPVTALTGSVFEYRSGQHAHLNVPLCSRLEWHPFTIASAPEDDHLTFYIKAGGRWTGKLYHKLKALMAEGSVSVESAKSISEAASTATSDSAASVAAPSPCAGILKKDGATSLKPGTRQLRYSDTMTERSPFEQELNNETWSIEEGTDSALDRMQTLPLDSRESYMPASSPCTAAGAQGQAKAGAAPAGESGPGRLASVTVQMVKDDGETIQSLVSLRDLVVQQKGAARTKRLASMRKTGSKLGRAMSSALSAKKFAWWGYQRDGLDGDGVEQDADAPAAVDAAEQTPPIAPAATAPPEGLGLDMEVWVEGPFGSPLEDPLKRRDYTGLVYTAGGVGITPFLSLLKSQAYLHSLPYHLTGKISLVWAERNQQTPRIAQDVWDAVAASNLRNRFDCRVYLTCVQGLTPVNEVWLRLCQALGGKYWGMCPITHIRGGAVDVNFGRPPWASVLTELGKYNPNGSVQVLYCGSEGVGNHIKSACIEASTFSRPPLLPTWLVRSLIKRTQRDECEFHFLHEHI